MPDVKLSCYAKYSVWTRSTGITWMLVRNVDWIHENLHFSKVPGDARKHVSLRITDLETWFLHLGATGTPWVPDREAWWMECAAWAWHLIKCAPAVEPLSPGCTLKALGEFWKSTILWTPQQRFLFLGWSWGIFSKSPRHAHVQSELTNATSSKLYLRTGIPTCRASPIPQLGWLFGGLLEGTSSGSWDWPTPPDVQCPPRGPLRCLASDTDHHRHFSVRMGQFLQDTLILPSSSLLPLDPVEKCLLLLGHESKSVKSSIQD